MAPTRKSKERPANLRPRPKRSVKLERQPGSSRDSTPDRSQSERGPSIEQEVMEYDQDESEGSHSVGQAPDEALGDDSMTPLVGNIPPTAPVDQGNRLEAILTEIRSLQGSVDRLHKRHSQTEQRVKAVEGECRGRKRSRSSDMSSSEEEGKKVRSKEVEPTRRSSSASSSDLDSPRSSDGERDRNRDLAWGASIPIDASIADKIKKKIWKGKFVDFRYLLDPEERPTKQRKLQLKISAVDSEVHTVAAQEPGPLADFALWDKAFHVFLAIIMKGSNKPNLDNLLIYRRSVQTMKQAGGDWERYDSKFRAAMTYLPKQMKWQHRQYDLWDDCMRRGKVDTKKPGHVQVKNNNPKFFPGSRVCYLFQRTGKCHRLPDCPFNHVCSTCNSPSHGSANCSKKPHPAPSTSNLSK